MSIPSIATSLKEETQRVRKKIGFMVYLVSTNEQFYNVATPMHFALLYD